MATTDRLTPWNTKHNFCALRPGYDYYPNGQHRDLEFAQVMSATSITNSIIRQLLGGTLGHGKVFRDRETGKVTRLPTGIEKISMAPGADGPRWFVPHPLKEMWAECPNCGTMNHFVRTTAFGQYFLCSKCR